MASTSAIRKYVTQYDVPKSRVLVCCCRSVDTKKFGPVIHALSEWAEVKGVMTNTAQKYFHANGEGRSLIPVDGTVITNNAYGSDLAVDIKLARWADIMVIAPLSAHTLAKISGALGNNLLTSIVKAWDYKKPMLVAPSMYDAVWRNPLTEKQLMGIEKLGVTVIPPVEHMQTNMREMADPSIISSTVKSFYDSKIEKDVFGGEDSDDDN